MAEMRIALLTEYYHEDAFGGAEYRLYLLARELVKLGHQVHYICISPNSVERLAEGIHVIPIKARLLSRRCGLNYFMYRSDIFGVLNRIRPDIIYQSVANAFTGIAASYARRTGCQMVWHIASEGDVRRGRSRSFHTALFDYIDRRWTEHGIRSADLIIGQARYQDRLLESNYGRHCDLLVGTPQPAPKRPIVKTGPVTVVWVANLKPLKRPEVFLRLVRELGDCQSVRFVMIGRPMHGSYQLLLEKEMAGLRNFAYLGEQSVERVNQILAQSHILVNTSRYEGFPNTFIQAWFRQVPVVSLNVDPDDVLKTVGLGFHSITVSGLVRDVRRLIENRALRECMGQQAQRYAERHHSMGPNIAKIVSLLTNTR